MNFRATSSYRPIDLSQVQTRVVPALTEAVTEASEVVAEEARAIVAIDTGALKDSIATEVVWEGTRIDGFVTAGGGDVNYASYVEFGTGRRGAASPGAGPYPYGGRPGMIAQPYLRPALDAARDQVLAAFKGNGFKTS